jgi:hypothetical protein
MTTTRTPVLHQAAQQLALGSASVPVSQLVLPRLSSTSGKPTREGGKASVVPWVALSLCSAIKLCNQVVASVSTVEKSLMGPQAEPSALGVVSANDAPPNRSVVGLFKRPGPVVAGSNCSPDRAVIKAQDTQKHWLLAGAAPFLLKNQGAIYWAPAVLVGRCPPLQQEITLDKST